MIPHVLIFDEPTNGLDPPGIRWVRDFVRWQAERGRAVLISSHLLAEVEQSVDDVVVIASGRLRAHGSIASVLGQGTDATFVRTPHATSLATLVAGPDVEVTTMGDDELLVSGASSAAVGIVAAEHGIPLVELRPHQVSLEDVFLEVTGDQP